LTLQKYVERLSNCAFNNNLRSYAEALAALQAMMDEEKRLRAAENAKRGGRVA
jgi:hypothetical protein